MKKLLYTALFPVTIFMLFSMSSDNPVKTLHDFKAKTLDGKDFDFVSLKGKKVLIVNVASECGYTPQYAGLQELFEKYDSTGKFTIIGFPCNQFGGQEPGTASDIQTFCSKNYGVTFPMMEKVDVKGENVHPVYSWLTHKSENGVEDSEVKWNFNKYAIDENGKYVRHYGSGVEPMSGEILNWINGGIGGADDTTTYLVPDEKPGFPGGENALSLFLRDNIKYPIESREKGRQGTVQVSYVVEKDGKVTNVKVHRSSGFADLDAEAVRVVSKYPDYTPGKIGGKIVRVKIVMPIKFTLQ